MFCTPTIFPGFDAPVCVCIAVKNSTIQSQTLLRLLDTSWEEAFMPSCREPRRKKTFDGLSGGGASFHCPAVLTKDSARPMNASHNQVVVTGVARSTLWVLVIPRVTPGDSLSFRVVRFQELETMGSVAGNLQTPLKTKDKGDWPQAQALSHLSSPSVCKIRWSHLRSIWHRKGVLRQTPHGVGPKVNRPKIPQGKEYGESSQTWQLNVA